MIFNALCLISYLSCVSIEDRYRLIFELNWIKIFGEKLQLTGSRAGGPGSNMETSCYVSTISISSSFILGPSFLLLVLSTSSHDGHLYFLSVIYLSIGRFLKSKVECWLWTLIACCRGRRGNEKVGVDSVGGEVKVMDTCKTIIKSNWCCGQCIGCGKYCFTLCFPPPQVILNVSALCHVYLLSVSFLLCLPTNICFVTMVYLTHVSSFFIFNWQRNISSVSDIW